MNDPTSIPTRAPWTCPTCRVELTSPFCPGCGERPSIPRDLTLHGLAEQVFRALSSYDSRQVRTLVSLIFRPGLLTLAYQMGQRRPFIAPIPLFLICNVIFFAVQSLTDLKIFSPILDDQISNQPLSDVARQMMTARLTALGMGLDQYRLLFNQAESANAKTLIGLMMLPFTSVPPLLFWRLRRPLAVHVVFALHFYSFLLLLFCVPLLAVACAGLFGVPAKLPNDVDTALTFALLISAGVYLHIAVGQVYAVRGLARLGAGFALTVAAAFIFLAYRFVLFTITLYTT